MSSFDRAHRISYSSLIEIVSILYRFRDTARYLSNFANFDLLHLHLAPPLGVTPFEFRKDFWHQKTRVLEPSRGIVCVVLRLAILVEHWLCDRHRHTHRQTQGHGIYCSEHSSCGKNGLRNGFSGCAYLHAFQRNDLTEIWRTCISVWIVEDIKNFSLSFLYPRRTSYILCLKKLC